MPAYETPEQLLALVAGARGKLNRGGTPNLEAAARMLLRDWNDGRIAYYTRPPARPDHGHASADVVPAWGADFDADEVGARPCWLTQGLRALGAEPW